MGKETIIQALQNAVTNINQAIQYLQTTNDEEMSYTKQQIIDIVKGYLLGLPGTGKFITKTDAGNELIFREGGTINEAPTANSVNITGTPEVGQTLTGNYTYADAENDAQGTSTRQWYRANDNSGTGKTAIVGATGATYVLTQDDAGKFIQFGVTPVAATGTSPGTQVLSSYTTAIAAATEFDIADIPDLKLWIDATDISSLTLPGGNSITAASDKSGNGYHVTAPGAASPFFTNGGKNNLPFIRFNANTQLSNNNFPLAQPFTMFAVIRSRVWQHLDKPISFYNVGLLQWYKQDLAPNETGGDSIGLHGNQFKATSSAAIGSTVNEWIPYQAHFNNGNSYIGVHGQINDHLQGPIGAGGATSIYINDGSEIDFHELIVIGREVTVEEAQGIHNYFNSKYGFPDKDTINFMGDSLTAGYDAVTVDHSATYVSLVADELNLDLHTRLAVSGSTLVGTMNYSLPLLLRTRPISKVVVMLGQNDSDTALANGWKASYEGYVQQMLDAGFLPKNIILCSTPPTGAGGANSGLRAAVQDICEQYNLTFCDQWTYLSTRLAESYVGAEVHPNIQGHRHLADNLKATILAIP